MISRSLRSSLVLLLFAACNGLPLAAHSIIDAGSATVWKYVADGRDPGNGWRQAEFDDSQWRAGPAPLGFGDPGMGTVLKWGTDPNHKPMTTWFRRSFEMSEVKPADQFAILYCVDDGAVVYLNGREVGRTNMPAGPVTTGTPALRALSDPDEGYYQRLVLPPQALKAGRNVLAVEVHQCNPASSDLYFDLALKQEPPPLPLPLVTALTRTSVTAYRQQHFLGPDVRIPDGYLDGGREMVLEEGGRATSRREILVLDRRKDAQLTEDIAFAQSPDLRSLSSLDRALRIAIYIDKRTTPYGGIRWSEKMDGDLVHEFQNQPVLLGDWVDESHNGVCRHRALLFKVLADEAGLKTALTRGNWAQQARKTPSFPHTWNELFLEGGRRVLVDVMMKGARQNFPDVSSPEVVEHYLKVDNTPWYSASPGK